MSTQHDDTASQESWTDTDAAEGLQPMRFLEGSWHSDGEGPYGPYALDATAEIRGRWMLLTYSISEPTSLDVFYVSTQVCGYDDDGLVLELFDTAGSFTFRGIVVGDENTTATTGYGSIGRTRTASRVRTSGSGPSSVSATACSTSATTRWNPAARRAPTTPTQPRSS